jgi:hypothetical protein
MGHANLELLATLRLAIGFLGERENPPWWPSNFFGEGSDAFLGPIFPRTIVLARYHGVVRAAARAHDEHTGVGRLYHLFRLPEDLEYALHVALRDQRLNGSILAGAQERASALHLLREAAGDDSPRAEGPVRLGGTASLRETAPWHVAVAHYANAFEGGRRVYPYFTDVR